MQYRICCSAYLCFDVMIATGILWSLICELDDIYVVLFVTMIYL